MKNPVGQPAVGRCCGRSPASSGTCPILLCCAWGSSSRLHFHLPLLCRCHIQLRALQHLTARSSAKVSGGRCDRWQPGSSAAPAGLTAGKMLCSGGCVPTVGALSASQLPLEALLPCFLLFLPGSNVPSLIAAVLVFLWPHLHRCFLTLRAAVLISVTFTEVIKRQRPTGRNTHLPQTAGRLWAPAQSSVLWALGDEKGVRYLQDPMELSRSHRLAGKPLVHKAFLSQLSLLQTYEVRWREVNVSYVSYVWASIQLPSAHGTVGEQGEPPAELNGNLHLEMTAL